MKIILTNDIDSLGKAGEIVDVKPGYARNFLIPSNNAIIATPSNLKAFQEEQKLSERREQKGKKEARLKLKQKKGMKKQ